MSALEVEPVSFLYDTELADVMRGIDGMWRAKPSAPIDEVVAEVECRAIKAMYLRGDVEVVRR